MQARSGDGAANAWPAPPMLMDQQLLNLNINLNLWETAAAAKVRGTTATPLRRRCLAAPPLALILAPPVLCDSRGWPSTAVCQ